MNDSDERWMEIKLATVMGRDLKAVERQRDTLLRAVKAWLQVWDTSVKIGLYATPDDEKLIEAMREAVNFVEDGES